MITRSVAMDISHNPLVDSPYFKGEQNAIFAPADPSSIITEITDDTITSEFGDFLITEY